MTLFYPHYRLIPPIFPYGPNRRHQATPGSSESAAPRPAAAPSAARCAAVAAAFGRGSERGRR